MTPKPLGREEVAQIVIALQDRKRYKGMDLDELVDTACYLLLFCGERAPIAEKNYERRKREEAAETSKIIPLAQVAKLVTGQSGKRESLNRFNRFCKSFSEKSDLVPEWERITACAKINAGSNTGYQRDFCDWLTEIYPRWWNFEQSQLQAGRAKGSQKKVEKTS